MYEQIPLSCACGRQPTRLREVGLTADRQLVIYWRCSDCRRHMYIVKPLSECMRECPDEGRIEVEAGLADNLSSPQPLEHHQKA